MLTAEGVNPNVLLQPFIDCYVQRETAAKDAVITEPVIPRAGTMLEFQFAAVYEIKAYKTEQLRPSWATTVIGPIDARRVRLILRDHVRSLVVMFRPLGMYRLFGVPIAPITGAGAEGQACWGRRSRLSISGSATRQASPTKWHCSTDFSLIGCSEAVRSIRQRALCTGWPQADAAWATPQE